MFRLSVSRVAFATLSIAATFAACTPPVPEGRFACVSDSDCPDSFHCAADSLCRSEAIDANVDTGTVDAGDDGGSCLTGYVAVGPACVDIDECASATSPCAPTQVCTNSAGSFSCACPVGEIMGSAECVPDVDECALNTDDCGANATCTNTADAFTCACKSDYVGDGQTCTLDLCDPSTDTDTGTFMIIVTHLGIPSADGFDLDDLNNAAVPNGMGFNVPGCGKTDLAGGIDNALAGLAGNLASVIDLGASYQEPITAGTSLVAVAFDHVAPSNPANDACIGVGMLVYRTGHPDQLVAGRGRLVDHVAHVRFDGQFALQARSTPVPDECTNMTCSPGTFAPTLLGGRGRFHLDPSHTDLLADSVIGGFMFFADADPAYATANMTGLQSTLAAYGTQTNWADTFETMFTQAYSGGRDLHMAVDGSLDYCTGATPNATNKNAISAALSLDSL